MKNNSKNIVNYQVVIKPLLNSFLDWLLPPLCPLTGEPVEHQGMISAKAWTLLRFVSAPFCPVCGVPQSFTYENQYISEQGVAPSCASCLTNPPPFAKARAALVYDDASRKLILSFKHADQTYAVKTFTPWLVRAGADFWPDRPLLVPVPLHRWRLLRRRYNQSALLSHALARQLDLTCMADGLLRVRATPTQGHLKAKERAQNVRKAFMLNPRHAQRLRGSHVVLVDDVFTTGATVKECAEALLRAGVQRVDILTLARVVRE